MSTLRNFITKKVTDGFTEIDISKEIADYRRNNKDQPTIVIDLFSIPLYENKYNNLCGGRTQHCAELIKFFEKLKEMNVNLIFVKKISKVDDNLEKRMRQKYRLHMDIIREMRTGTSFEEIIQKHGQHLSSPILIKSDMCLIAAQYGTIIQALKHDDVASYLASIAFNYKALAVLTDKLAVIFFKGKYQFWSSHNLNLETLKTNVYNREGFREYLNLTENQMPFLSTLMGNNLLTLEKVQKFHGKFGTNLIENLASYINNFPEILTDEDFITIASDIDCNSIKYDTDLTSSIKKSLKAFDFVEILRPTDEILEFIWESMSANMYILYDNVPDSFTCNFFDYRRPNQTPFPDIIKPLLRKQVGFLWKHKSNTKDLTYKFYSQRVHFQFRSEEIVDPIYPSIHVPPLLQLLDQKKYPALDSTRFELVCWIITDKLKANAIKNYPKEYFIDVITLRYMINEQLLSCYEADAIMLTINAVIEKRVPAEIPLPTHLTARAFHLAHLFTVIRFHIQMVVESVGLLDRITVFNFDAVYFHNFYLDWSNTQPQDRAKTLSKHPPLSGLSFVYRDNNMHRQPLDRSHNDRRRLFNRQF